MTYDRTRLLARQLDRERARNGPEGDLELKSFDDSQQPSTVLASVTSGWGAKFDGPDVTLTIVETAVDEDSLDAAAVLGVENRDYVKIPKSSGGVTFSTVAPRVWTVKGRLLGVE